MFGNLEHLEEYLRVTVSEVARSAGQVKLADPRPWFEQVWSRGGSVFSDGEDSPERCGRRSKLASEGAGFQETVLAEEEAAESLLPA